MFTSFPPVCPITTVNNATAPAAQSPGFVSLPGCVYTATTTVQPTHTHMVSLPGCVHTGQTMCCPDTGSQPQAQTVFPTFPTASPACLPMTLVCGPGPVIPPAHGGNQAQAQGMLSAFPCPTVATCPPTWNCGGQVTAPAQAQFPTLSVECLKTATHVATAVLGCNAQAQGLVSGINALMNTGEATAQAMASAYPCPTVATCPPTWNCGGAAAPAQAQFPTLSLECVRTATVAATAVLGCNSAAQAQAPVAGQHMLSAFPCPTVANCPPVPPLSAHPCPTVANCPPIPPLSAHPCPTVDQCVPTWNCGGQQAIAPAQAQFPTLSLNCVTVTTVTV